MKRTMGIVVSAGFFLAASALLAWTSNHGEGPTPTPVAAAPKPPPPPPPVIRTIETAGDVTLETTPSAGYLLHRGTGELFLDISLRGARASQNDRAPLNVCLVVDRSGSMSGKKLLDAKRAARMLVRRLVDGDRLAIVTYGSGTTLLLPSTRISPRTRSAVLAAIDGITARGQTFLSGGYVRGRDEVLRQGLQGFVNRVILISDGKANRGITSVRILSAMSRAAAARGIHSTTMGVGLRFNEDLMTAVATHGAGHSYFIERSSALASVIRREIDTMIGTVAKSAVVTLTLEPGVRLTGVYGYAHHQRGRTVTIKIPDVYGGQRRKIICRFQVPATRVGAQAVADVKLAFHDPRRGADEVIRSTARVVVTRDADRVARGKNRKVAAKVEQVKVATTMREAAEAYQAGDPTRSAALLKDQIDGAARRNRWYRDGVVSGLVRKMRRQLRRTRAAPRPASSPGQSLIKQGKYDAINAFH